MPGRRAAVQYRSVVTRATVDLETCIVHIGAMSQRLTNLLGALATAITDRMNDALTAVPGETSSAAAGVLVVAQWPGGTIDSFAKALGLSHSAAVRVVDRLVAAGEIERRPGDRGRALALVATSKGRRAAHDGHSQ